MSKHSKTPLAERRADTETPTGLTSGRPDAGSTVRTGRVAFREELNAASAELAIAIGQQAIAATTAQLSADDAERRNAVRDMVRAQNEIDRCREYRDGVSALWRASLHGGDVGTRLVFEVGHE